MRAGSAGSKENDSRSVGDWLVGIFIFFAKFNFAFCVFDFLDFKFNFLLSRIFVVASPLVIAIS